MRRRNGPSERCDAAGTWRRAAGTRKDRASTTAWSTVGLLIATSLAAVAPAVAGVIRGNAACGDDCGDLVIHLEGVAGDYRGEGQVAELGQRNKIFIPHVVPLLRGSTLRIGNDDPYMHNVQAHLGKTIVFNLNTPFQYQTVDQVIAEAGVYRILCDLHPEMLAFVVALENPFFATPDAAGAFEIRDVPPGRYSLVRLDAERNRIRVKPVVVGDGELVVSF